MGCSGLGVDMDPEIDEWVRDLKAVLEKYRPHPDAGLAAATASLGRKKYVESVVRQQRYIQSSGMAEIGTTAEVEMARVFVTPRMAAQGETAREPWQKERQTWSADHLVTAEGASHRLVILGGPGTGKTTLLEGMALASAGGSELGWAKEVPKLLPVFYRIRDLDRDRETHGAMWSCIQQQCSRQMGEQLPAGFFHRQMEAGGLAVLFDGLDEAGSLARRNELVDRIAEFAEGLSGNSRVIVTSRPHDYKHRFEGASWRHYELCEFNDTEIQSFIQGWRAIHEPHRAQAVEKGERLWRALQGRQDILPLARNALLLTMIVRVHFGLGALPDSRLGLYEKCTETLLKHWAEPKGLEPSPIDFTQKHKLLQKLAYEMQGEAERLSGEMALQISRADLAGRFRGFLEDEGCPDAFHLVEKLIVRLHARDAILVAVWHGPAGPGPVRVRASVVSGILRGVLDGARDEGSGVPGGFVSGPGGMERDAVPGGGAASGPSPPGDAAGAAQGGSRGVCDGVPASGAAGAAVAAGVGAVFVAPYMGGPGK